jgi:hypothetical protein
MMKFTDASGIVIYLDPRQVLLVRPVFHKLKDGEDPKDRRPVEDHAQLVLAGTAEMPIVQGSPSSVAESIMKKAFRAQVVTLRDGVAPALQGHAKTLKE